MLRILKAFNEPLKFFSSHFSLPQSYKLGRQDGTPLSAEFFDIYTAPLKGLKRLRILFVFLFEF